MAPDQALKLHQQQIVQFIAKTRRYAGLSQYYNGKLQCSCNEKLGFTMGIYATDLRELIIRPTLEWLNDWSQSAENLLMGTAAQESHLGFRMQSDKTCGLGLYCISAKTHTQVWDEFLVTDPELASRLRGLASQQQFLTSPHNELIVNLSYASGVAWMIYKRHQLKLTENLNSHDLAKYWLNYYCNRDTATDQTMCNDDVNLDSFVQNYRSFVLRENKSLAA